MRNIADVGLSLREALGDTAPLVVIAGACMNSGKTYAATEIIQQGTRAGLRVAAAKLSGIACLRDTLNMADHGAIATASFLDCGLPSTVGVGDLAPVAKAIIARLNENSPDLIVIELGDGILGGYSVESVFEDEEFRKATAALVFCASDYVGAWGGIGGLAVAFVIYSQVMCRAIYSSFPHLVHHLRGRDGVRLWIHPSSDRRGGKGCRESI